MASLASLTSTQLPRFRWRQWSLLQTGLWLTRRVRSLPVPIGREAVVGGLEAAMVASWEAVKAMSSQVEVAMVAATMAAVVTVTALRAAAVESTAAQKVGWLEGATVEAQVAPKATAGKEEAAMASPARSHSE